MAAMVPKLRLDAAEASEWKNGREEQDGRGGRGSRTIYIYFAHQSPMPITEAGYVRGKDEGQVRGTARQELMRLKGMPSSLGKVSTQAPRKQQPRESFPCALSCQIIAAELVCTRMELEFQKMKTRKLQLSH
jgi:hypothetical protein